MRIFDNLANTIDQLPGWGQIVLGIGLILFSIASIYGRINVKFGAKVFSKIPPEEIRSNMVHIIGYTVVPVAATLFYLYLLLTR